MKLEGKHWVILGALAVAVGMHLKSLHSWGEAVTPAAVGEMVFQIGTVIAAMFVGSPSSDKSGEFMQTSNYKRIVLFVTAVGLAASLAACASSTPRLPINVAASPRLKVALVTRDVVTSVTAAHDLHRIADKPTVAVLKVCDRVLELAGSEQTDYASLASVAIRTARDALDAVDQRAAAQYLDRLDKALAEILK